MFAAESSIPPCQRFALMQRLLCTPKEFIRDTRQTEGYARSLSLNLLGQYVGFEKNGQFRFTPPTHVVVSFQQALIELEHEGGVEARLARYTKNHKMLLTSMLTSTPGFSLYRELNRVNVVGTHVVPTT